MKTLNEQGQIIIQDKVSLKPYQSRIFKPYELMTDEEILKGAGGNLILDSEFYINYSLLAFMDIITKKIIKFEINYDKDMYINEKKLSWIMHSYRTIGFNSIKYDLPLLWLAYSYQNTHILKQASNKLIFGNIWHSELQKEYRYKIFPTPHIDLIEVCPLRGSLKLYAARLHAERLQDLPIHHETNLNQDEINIISDYCINSDLPATNLIYDNLSEQLKLREELSRQYKQDLMSKSDAQIAEAVIGSELKRLSGKWPSKPKIDNQYSFNYKIPNFIFFQSETLKDILDIIASATYSLEANGRLIIPKEIENLEIKVGTGTYRFGIGGLHSSEKEIAIIANDEYELIDRDVASYYPRIVLNLGLFPTHIGTDFLKVYQDIVNRRLEAKKNKNIAVAECLKITINGTFGKTGSPYSILYAPEMTIQITITGQLALLMLIEKLELSNIEVVSANTDGIVIYCHKSKKEELNNIIKMWEKITNFETEETKYKAIYSRDVNAYIAIKENNEVKGKNLYYDPWRGKTAKDNYWKFQKNPTTQICVEAIEKLIMENIPIEKTIIECRDIKKFIAVKNVTGGAHKDNYYLGKVIRWYYAINVIGAINYINTNNKVPDSDGAFPCMDLPEIFPSNINYQWYIDKTIEMLHDLNYYKRPKQLVFF